MEIAVISGKGGTGKSSITAAFATMGSHVVLADCDVDAANQYLIFNPTQDEEQVYIGGHKAVIDYGLCTSCGLCMNYCRFGAISLSNGHVTISETSCDGCFLCSRVCLSSAINMVPSDKSRMYSGLFRNGHMVYGRLAPGEENSGKLVNMVRDKAKEVAEKHNVPTILVDGPPGVGCPVISTITGVNKVVIITEPTISGKHDLERAVEITEKFNLKPEVIINKSDINVSMSQQIEEWCIQKGINVAGKLPFDKRVVEAMVNHKSINELFPDAEISVMLGEIWRNIQNI
jgi:MinD superfamily P-loop ATPase containing an inserted ferredoxin domain